MACHCFNWATGASICIGREFPDTVEHCRARCRRAGLAALCNSNTGDCGADECGRGHRWKRSCRVMLRLWVKNSDFPGNHCIFGDDFGVGVFEYACSENRPGDQRTFELLDTRSNDQLCADTPPGGGPGQSGDQTGGGSVRSIECGDFDDPGDLYDNLWTGPFEECIPIKTPCCLSSGSVPCRHITPAECIALCGQPFEGTITWENPDNPCLNTGPAYPCNRHPCCSEPYPDEFPLVDPSTLEDAIAYGRFCDVRTQSSCERIGGASSTTSRSCFEFGGCFGNHPDDDTKCIEGKWELVYRPEGHKPPSSKEWLEGSTEIVSAKPEKVTTPFADDCAYHYGDVAYSREIGSAVGVICSELPARRQIVNDRCPTHFANDWCPLVYGEDGNARFSCAYRVRN